MSILLLLGAAAAAVPMSVSTLTGTNGVAVAPGWSYTACCDVRAAASARSVSLVIRWYDDGGTLISDSAADTATDSTSAWTNLSITATSPNTACFAALVVEWDAVAAAEVHYTDNAGLFRMTTPYTP